MAFTSLDVSTVKQIRSIHWHDGAPTKDARFNSPKLCCDCNGETLFLATPGEVTLLLLGVSDERRDSTMEGAAEDAPSGCSGSRRLLFSSM